LKPSPVTFVGTRNHLLRGDFRIQTDSVVIFDESICSLTRIAHYHATVNKG